MEMTRMEIALKGAEYERACKWREIWNDMPFIQFPANWQVAICPPFGGATARFRVKLPDGRIKSIYADHYGRLGCYGYPEEVPYWEVYPCGYGVGRCDLADIPQLLKLIESGGDLE